MIFSNILMSVFTIYQAMNVASMIDRFRGIVETVEPPMHVTIIMPVYREPEYYLRASLRSLNEQTVLRDYQDMIDIVIVGVKGDELPDIVYNYSDNVIYAPRGKLRARDMAIRMSYDGIIVSVDADTVYPPEWLASHLVWYYHPEVVATTGPTDIGSAEPYYSIVKHVWYSSKMNGRNSTFLKRAYTEVGGFDLSYDDLFLITGDTDILMEEEEFNFMKKLRTIGRVVYVPRPSVVHLGENNYSRGLRAP